MNDSKDEFIYIGEFQPCNEDYFPIHGDNIKEALLLQNSIDSVMARNKFCMGQVIERTKNIEKLNSSEIDCSNYIKNTRYQQTVNFSSKPWHVEYCYQHTKCNEIYNDNDNVKTSKKRKKLSIRYCYVISVLEHCRIHGSNCLKVIAQFRSNSFNITKTPRLKKKVMLQLIDDKDKDLHDSTMTSIDEYNLLSYFATYF